MLRTNALPYGFPRTPSSPQPCFRSNLYICDPALLSLLANTYKVYTLSLAFRGTSAGCVACETRRVLWDERYIRDDTDAKMLGLHKQ